MKYAIGLDCGITSVGYAVMELDNDDNPKRIIKLGTRIFDKAEHPKDGSSLAAPRREARGLRRRIRRHNHRLQRIKYMLIQENILTSSELEHLYDGQLSDVYELRTKALDQLLTNKEFARVLINLSQRRGFKSNRKNDANEGENGKLLTAVNNNQLLMKEKGYRTVGEMFFKDEKYAVYKRNKGEDYRNTVSRSMIADEIKAVFASQRLLGASFANEFIEQKYTDIVLSQRPFDLGPGEGNENSPSPYAGNQIEKMIGKCTFYPEEHRAARATYSFQYFSLLQNINNITLVKSDGEKRCLDDAEKTIIRQLCFKTASVKYSSIRKAISLPDEYLFNNLTYADNDINDVEKKAKFEHLKFYHEIKKAIKDAICTLSPAELNTIGYIFTVHRDDEKILEELKKAQIDSSLWDALLTLPFFSKFGHISVKACDQLIPFLEKGLSYSKACESVGIDFKAHSNNEKQKLLSANNGMLDEIINPVVKRAVSQTIRVVNAIIREQTNSPTYINIEVARELSKSHKQRKEIEKQNLKNKAMNDKIIVELAENFGIIYPSGQDIVKLKLWHEQDGIDPYSLKPLQYERLFDDGYVDVDHIIPYSISFDDSYNNKVLTSAKENRQKSNKIPMHYLPEEKKSDYRVWVNNTVKNYKKRQNLLKEKLTADDVEGFKSRNLNDTKYLSRFLFNYINDTLVFEDYSNAGKKHVHAVNGATTAYVRKRWGISKIREDGDLHHAVDAVVIACITDSMIRRISDYSKFREVQYSDAHEQEGAFVVDKFTGEILDKFPYPYPSFKKELEIRTNCNTKERLEELLSLLPNYSGEDVASANPCFVSRMQNHKVTGAAHKATIYSGKKEGYTISKVALSELKLDSNNEIINYYAPESDTLLYNALKKRMIAFGGDGAKAFPPEYEFHKPKANGEDGPIVKKVKIIEKSSLNVSVRHGNGLAKNESMVRIDVFFVENDGYYFVPIYVADTVKKQLPNKACVAHKSYNEWKVMDDNNFIFSLYPNDLIKVAAKKDIKFTVNLKDSTLPKEKYGNEVFVYYNSADISSANIKVITDDNSYFVKGLGIKSLVNLEKYTVDAIGNIGKVKKERRMGFN